jgi:hypothetical protein
MRASVVVVVVVMVVEGYVLKMQVQFILFLFNVQHI